ncbi:hypothetical protein Q8A67_021811 [Cirrhinus molitorella]|uniref:DUF4806 domain-containing protein n=1 Tax=Cirrhinus molitorella TaxID=172907 RepID=A0AA88P7P3_9TELE|nr:hypothetical protein Q8A67_021811 [Cirrhinus molitorella]
MDLSGGLETAAALSQSSSDSSDVLTLCAEARLAVSSAREEEDVVFQLYDSEELDMLSIDVGELPENSPLHSHVQEELVDVLACAVAKLNINCHKKVRNMMPFAIVDFLDGGGVAVVPCKWFTGPEEDACYWPPGRVNITKAVKEEVVPNSDWPQFKVRILGKAGNYEHATSKLRKSEVTSDLQTESDSGGNLGKGKRKKRAVILSSSDEDSDGAGHDRPPSTVPLLPPVPEICQPEAPQALNIRPFVQPRPPSTPPAVLPDHRLQHGTNNSAFRDGMFTRLLSLLEEIKETQRVHGKMIQSLLTQRDGNTVAVLPQEIHFPLKTVSDVEEMELKLADPTIHKEVVAVVADIGGSTVDEATRRMMTFLLDHSLSREYNFVGRHGKREFGGLRLFEVMYGSLKKNALTNQITRKDAEKAVSKWLIGARDRGGYRNARARAGEQNG